MAAASLALLKGATKKSVDQELAKAEPEAKPAAAPVAAPAAEAVEEEITVDVDVMSVKELELLVKDNEVAVPDEWKKWPIAKKRNWLKEQFEEAPEGEAEAVADKADDAADGDEVSEEELVKTLDAIDTPEEAPVVEAKPKGKAKGKAVGKAGLNGEVLANDELSSVVHEIETLSEKVALDMVGKLAEVAEFTYFKLGGVLSVIQANNWFEGYASFREFVEKKHGIHYRRATYWVQIYNDLVAADVSWDKVKPLGWTKLKEISSIITKENVDDWVKMALSQTTLQLIETVANHKKADAPKALEDQASTTVTTMTFKVHDDQKETLKAAIAKAKEISGTGVDSAALEFIALDYLGSAKKPKSMIEQLKGLGLEAALAAVEAAFPDASVTVEVSK